MTKKLNVAKNISTLPTVFCQDNRGKSTQQKHYIDNVEHGLPKHTEIADAISKLKNHKMLGAGGIPANLY